MILAYSRIVVIHRYEWILLCCISKVCDCLLSFTSLDYFAPHVPPHPHHTTHRYTFSAIVLFLFTEPIRPKGKTLPELLFEDFWRGLPVESTTHTNVRMAAIYARHNRLAAVTNAAASATGNGAGRNGDVKHKAD